MSETTIAKAPLWADDTLAEWHGWSGQDLTWYVHFDQTGSDSGVLGSVSPGMTAQGDLWGTPSAHSHQAMVGWLNESVRNLLDAFAEQASARMMAVRIKFLETEIAKLRPLEGRISALEDMLAAPKSVAVPQLLDVSRSEVAEAVLSIAKTVFVDMAIESDWEDDPVPDEPPLLVVRVGGGTRSSVREARSEVLRRVHEELPAPWFRAFTLKVVRAQAAED